MKNSKTKSLKVFDKIVTRDGVNYPVFKYVKVQTAHVIYYAESFHACANLSSTERIYLNYLAMTMDHENMIISNFQCREGFNNLYRKQKPEGFSDNYLRKLISTLVQSNLLIAHINKKRGAYHVNPIFIAKDDENRDRLVRVMSEKGLLHLESDKNL